MSNDPSACNALRVHFCISENNVTKKFKVLNNEMQFKHIDISLYRLIIMLLMLVATTKPHFEEVLVAGTKQAYMPTR
jgi:hypothetical protein